jgi:hypothetical protein
MDANIILLGILTGFVVVFGLITGYMLVHYLSAIYHTQARICASLDMLHVRWIVAFGDDLEQDDDDDDYEPDDMPDGDKDKEAAGWN